MCILSLHALLKVVGHYDLSVLSMSVMGFQKNSLDGGWAGGVSSIQFFLDFWNCFNFASEHHDQELWLNTMVIKLLTNVRCKKLNCNQ